MKRLAFAAAIFLAAIFLAAATVFADDPSFPQVETQVVSSLAPFDEIAVASSQDVDLVLWTSGKHLYAARIGRDGTLLDGTPLDLSANAFFASAASDGSRFVVMWATGDSVNFSPLAFQAVALGAGGDAGPVTTLLTNANFWSRPRIEFGAGRFAFAWIDDTPFNPAFGTYPQGRISFVTAAANGLEVATEPFAIGAQLGAWIDFSGTTTTYWDYVPPKVVPVSGGVAAIWYDATLTAPSGCPQITGACYGPSWDYDARHSLLRNENGAFAPVLTSPSLYKLTSWELTAFASPRVPVAILDSQRTQFLWTTDEYLPQRDRGDTIRVLSAVEGAVLQPGPGAVMFSSQVAAIRQLDAVTTGNALWIAWTDRMRDFEPAQPQRVFVERAADSGEKATYPSIQGVSKFAMSSSSERVAIASLLPDGFGGRIVLDTIVDPMPRPSRTRPVQR